MTCPPLGLLYACLDPRRRPFKELSIGLYSDDSYCMDLRIGAGGNYRRSSPLLLLGLDVIAIRHITEITSRINFLLYLNCCDTNVPFLHVYSMLSNGGGRINKQQQIKFLNLFIFKMA